MEDSRQEAPVREQEAGRSELREAIGRRAQELYEARGREEGHAVEDWLQAEREILRELAREEPETCPAAEKSKPKVAGAPRAAKCAFFNVKVDGILYTVQYDAEHCDCYRPGMLHKGQPVEIRFEDDRVYMKLPNSKEVEAKIVRKAQT